MFKCKSLIRIQGKGKDKNENFNSSTLPMSTTTTNNNIGNKSKESKWKCCDTMDLRRSCLLDVSSVRRYFGGVVVDDCNLENEECIVCSNSDMKCLQLRKKIYREERLRDGADRLLGIVKDSKVRIKILGELNSINTKLQSLREQHTQLSISYHDAENTTQLTKKCCKLPMLSPELKEIKMNDCFAPLKKYLTSHYYEDPDDFQQEFKSLDLLRKKCVNPRSDDIGVSSIYQYYNQLFFVERRFLSNQSNKNNNNNNNNNGDVDNDYEGFDNDDHCNGVVFEWYDTFTGMKSSQSSIGFEKGCLLFNVGVLYAKIAIKKRKINVSGNTFVGGSTDYFLRASGIFKHLRENFNDAPSCDLQWNCSEMLMELMLLQQHEIVVEDDVSEIIALGDDDDDDGIDFKSILAMAKCASYLSNGYSKIGSRLSALSSIPRFWCDVVDCKQNYYESLTQYLLSLLCRKILRRFEEGGGGDDDGDDDVVVAKKYLKLLDVACEDVGEDDMVMMATNHIQSCLAFLEEAIKISKNYIKLQFSVQQTFGHLLQKAMLTLKKMLKCKQNYDKSMRINQYINISSSPGKDLKPICPEFSSFRVEDLFKRLGCLSIFSSHRTWSHPRVVMIERSKDEELGFSISGDKPAVVASIQHWSPASKTSMKTGDLIFSINDVDVKWTPHGDIIKMIKSTGNAISVTIVTPGKNKNGSPDDSFAESSSTLNADDVMSVKDLNNCSETVSQSSSKKSLTSEEQWKNPRIVSVLKAGSLSRTFQVDWKKFSKRREEIINTDNVVIIERNY